jgi:hypothetical protein
MLSLFAISYNTMRLGLEAQAAAISYLDIGWGHGAGKSRTNCGCRRSNGNNDRAEKAPRVEEDSQKIGPRS